MLRPATPLAILLFVAFVLLLLSVISTPIVKAIPLASFQGVDYGVFGFCQGAQCTKIMVGYAAATTTDNSASFTLSAGTRHSLSSLLIVHPIAAFLTLICFILAVTAHVHTAAHSSRYHLALIILLLPTILITLLAFLVDILLFIPHLAWGGWIVLASTILLVISGVVTCAMRRMLVSRKARQRRINDNPDMNGANNYNNQSYGLKADSPPPLTEQPTAPMMNGNGSTGMDKPGFATFESGTGRRMSEDDRIPLNSRAPSAPSTSSGMRPGYEDGMMDRYGQPGRGGMFPMRGGRGGGRGMYNGPRDEFGNPLPPSPAFGPGPGMRRDSGDQRLRHQYSNETMNSQGSRGRGRGGYPPRGYGRGGAFGGPRSGPGMNGNGRGGIPLGPMVAGAGAGMMAGEMMGRGPGGPPPGYGNGYPPQGRGGPPQYGRNESPAGYGARGGYGRRPSPGPPSAPGGYISNGREQSPGGMGAMGGQRYRQASDPPPLPLQSDEMPGIGQAVEMDATTGSPQTSPGFEHHPLRESDSDVAGLVGLQQARIGSPLREDPRGPVNEYNQNEAYAPPRSAWNSGPTRNGTPPLNTNKVDPPPVELAARHSPPRIHTPSQNHSPTAARMSSDNYYEDVDPRFAEPELSQQEPPIPSLLMPGRVDDAPNAPEHGMGVAYQQQHLGVNQGHSQQPSFLEPTSSYESFEGSRSPAESDMTSISRRGVNPEWRPQGQQAMSYGPGGQGYMPHGVQGQVLLGPYNGPGGFVAGVGGVPNRRPAGQRTDVLSANPDFELGPRGRGRGM